MLTVCSVYERTCSKFTFCKCQCKWSMYTLCKYQCIHCIKWQCVFYGLEWPQNPAKEKLCCKAISVTVVFEKILVSTIVR